MKKVTVQLPEPLYRRFQGAAQVSHRTVDEVLSATLAVALPLSPNLSEALASELVEMIWMSDDALWAATRPTLSEEQQERLAELNDLNDDRSLTEGEESERTRLLVAYERSVLRRAQAFAILFHRGYVIPSYAELARAAWVSTGSPTPAQTPEKESGTEPFPSSEHPNHVWTNLFLFDQLADSRPFKTVSILDKFTPECLAILLTWMTKAEIRWPS